MLRTSFDTKQIIVGGPVYRAYRLDTAGRIEGVEHVLARDDGEAAMLAAHMANIHGIDLWERLRYVGSFPPLRPSAPGAKA